MAGKNLIAFAPLVQISDVESLPMGLQQRYNFDGTKINNGKGDLWIFGVKVGDDETYYKKNNWYDSLATINSTAWTTIPAGVFDNIDSLYDIAQSPNGKIWIISGGRVAGVWNIYMTHYNGSAWSSWTKVNTTGGMTQSALYVVGEEIVIAYGVSSTVFYKKFSQSTALASILALTENTLLTLTGGDSYTRFSLKLLASKSFVFTYIKNSGANSDYYARVSPPINESPDLTGFSTSSDILIQAGVSGNAGYLIELTDKRLITVYNLAAGGNLRYKLSNGDISSWGTPILIADSHSMNYIFEDYLSRIWILAKGTTSEIWAQFSGWTPNNIPITTWA